MFDPAKFFLKDNVDKFDNKNLKYYFFWFMNLAIKYCYVYLKEVLIDLEFRMHHYLQPNAKSTWQKTFKESPNYWVDFKKKFKTVTK